MKNTFRKAAIKDWGAMYLDCPRYFLVNGARRKNKKAIRRKARRILNKEMS